MCRGEGQVVPDEIAAGKPDRRGASVARCRQRVEQRRDETVEPSLDRALKKNQLGIAEKGANASRPCQIARSEIAGADQRETRQPNAQDRAIARSRRSIGSSRV